MNYLDRASKHIVSSHHLRNQKRSFGRGGGFGGSGSGGSVVGGPIILGLFLIMILIFFLARSFIGDILFGFRGLILPNPQSEITLLSGAFESNTQALEVENARLKLLLEQSGIRVPNFDSSDSNNILGADSEGGENSDTEINSEDEENSLASTTDTLIATKTSSVSETSTGTNIDSIKKAEGPLSRKIKLEDGDVISTVLIRPPQSPYDVIVIDRGQDIGISEGDQVYVWEGFPIGEVVTVYKNRSIVKLLSAPGNKVEVYIGTSTTAVVAEGKGGGNFFLKLPKVSDIKDGDLVARNFLPPEVFSSIESVDSNAGEAYTYAYFKLPINLNNLVYVLVKKNTAK